jgi:hypothetical protein
MCLLASLAIIGHQSPFAARRCSSRSSYQLHSAQAQVSKAVCFECRILTRTETCRLFGARSTVAWEVALTTLDIVTDLLGQSPCFGKDSPILTDYNSDLYTPIVDLHVDLFFNTRRYQYLFKCLSIFAIASAACRLAFQYNTEARRIDYVSLTLWLVIEAAVAVIAASISSYRVVVLDYLKDHRVQQQTSARTRIWHARSFGPGN